jgi:hypothetical protein
MNCKKIIKYPLWITQNIIELSYLPAILGIFSGIYSKEMKSVC